MTTGGRHVCVYACLWFTLCLHACVCTYVSEDVCFGKNLGSFIALIRISVLRNDNVSEVTVVCVLGLMDPSVTAAILRRERRMEGGTGGGVW